MENFHLQFINASFNEAQQALDAKEVPVGCVIVENNQIIARGFNSPSKLKNATKHAEIIAIQSLNSKDLSNCSLYVTVEPCIMCAAALRKCNLTKVYFGCKNEKFGGCGSILSIHNDTRLQDPQLDIQLYDSLIPNMNFSLKAIVFLRQFYLLENENAPNPKQKSKRILYTT